MAKTAPPLWPPPPPRTRADCKDGPRPCPHLSCRHHLVHAVRGSGVLALAGLPLPAELRESLPTLPDSCALDVADRGGVTLREAGLALGLTRERIRQIEGRALRKLRRGMRALRG